MATPQPSDATHRMATPQPSGEELADASPPGQMRDRDWFSSNRDRPPAFVRGVLTFPQVLYFWQVRSIKALVALIGHAHSWTRPVGRDGDVRPRTLTRCALRRTGEGLGPEVLWSP